MDMLMHTPTGLQDMAHNSMLGEPEKVMARERSPECAPISRSARRGRVPPRGQKGRRGSGAAGAIAAAAARLGQHFSCAAG